MKFTLNFLDKNPYWHFCRDVQQICQPMFEQFGINYFDYSRFYPDNTCVAISSDPHYVKFLLSEDSYQCAAGRVPIGKHMWQSYVKPDFINSTSQHFDYFHGITLVQKQTDYLELINFSASEKNTHVLNIYLNHFEILEYFLVHFLSIVTPFFKKNKDTRILLPNDFLGEPLPPFVQTNTMQFVKEINKINKVRKNTFLFKIDNKTISLSQREIECLQYLTRGYSTKKMARNMDLSVRTIDIFCNKILSKLEISSRIELLSKVDESTTKVLDVIASDRTCLSK